MDFAPEIDLSDVVTQKHRSQQLPELIPALCSRSPCAALPSRCRANTALIRPLYRWRTMPWLVLGFGLLIVAARRSQHLLHHHPADSVRHVVWPVPSRIDLASFYAGLPMLALLWIRKPNGTINPASFLGVLWTPLKEAMIAAAASHQWTAEELAAVRSRLLELPDDSAELQWSLLKRASTNDPVTLHTIFTESCAKTLFSDYPKRSAPLGAATRRRKLEMRVTDLIFGQ